jgi:tRNA threonylcarbamoyl adenosine modification protein (Sua5/YciO/YrdC/YwlC family)
VRIEIDPWATQGRQVHRAVVLLAEGGVLAIPTDSGYALACDLHCHEAIERIYDLKQNPRSHPLSVMFAEVDDIGRYAGYMSSLTYRTLKRLLPGPYTFIVEAGPEVPKRMHKRRPTIGIRVPEAEIPRALVRGLGRPLASTSLRVAGEDEDDEERWIVDPTEIELSLGSRIDAVVDGGLGIEDPTSVVDLTRQPFLVLRRGQGDVSLFQ